MEFKHGKGHWKFNNSLLYNTDYRVNQIIKKTKKDYASPVYNIKNLENIPNVEIQFTVNDKLFLKTILLEIRGKTLQKEKEFERKIADR